MSAPAPAGSVLANPGFLRLWGAQLLSQTAQNGLMLVLLVLVTERSTSSVNGSLLVLAFMLPSVLFSIPAGVLVDRWHKRTVMIAANLARSVFALLFMLAGHWVPALFLLTLVFSATGQFFTPAESATIPALVPRERLINANTLFQLTLTGSQFLGLVVLAPALLKTGGPDLYFGLMAALYLVAALLVAALPRGFEPERRRQPFRPLVIARELATDIDDVLRALRADRAGQVALAQLTVSASLAMLFGLLVPRFVHDVLDVAADNAVFVFAPVGIGAVLGLRALGTIGRYLEKEAIVTIGLAGAAAALLALASVDVVGEFLEQAGAQQWIDGLGSERPRFATLNLSVLVVVTMLFAVPMGFFYALINAPAQTIIHERAPAAMRGRYLGTQMLLANAASLVLLLVAGACADRFGVPGVLLGFAPVVAAVAVIGRWPQRRVRPGSESAAGEPFR